MVLKKLWLLPVATFCFFIGSMIISYLVAVACGHADSFWPYISTAGAIPPASCIFGQLLNIAAVFLAICVYLRHRQIVTFYEERAKKSSDGYWRMASVCFMGIGFLSALGTSIVANFQETSVLTVHMIGAFMAFGFGLLYGWAQTIYSYILQPRMTTLSVNHIRTILCTMGTVFFITMMATGFGTGAAHKSSMNDRTTPANEPINHWDPDEAGFAGHIASTMSEWLMVISFQLYILSFAFELRYAQLCSPKLILTWPQDPTEQQQQASPSYIDNSNYNAI